MMEFIPDKKLIQTGDDRVFLQIGILILLFVMLFLCDRLLRKNLGIKRPKGFFSQSINKTQSFIENGLFILFIVIMFTYAFIPDGAVNQTLLFLLSVVGYVFALQGVRTFFQWKYKKEEREYILTIFWGISYIPAILILWLIH
jgi:hypothetical protein